MCLSLICCWWMLLSSVFGSTCTKRSQMCNSQLGMRNSSCCCLYFPAFGNAAVNHTTTLFVNHGESAKIGCNYSRTDDTEIMTVDLKALNQTRMCSYIHLNSWQKQSCKDRIRFIWNPEAEEISFELLNLHIKDTGKYTCIVRRTAKPPEVDLGVERVHIIVYPILSLSCVKRPDGSPMILCSVDFYHDSLEQFWIRDGDILNSSYSNKSFNGYFSQQSYLIIPPQTFNDTIYSCWVNHSSLNKQLVANLSSSVCYESGGVTVTVVFVMLTVVLTVLLITPVICIHYKRACQQSVSPVGVSFTPEPVLHDHLQSEILYSTLGNHHPVPCSTAIVRTFVQ